MKKLLILLLLCTGTVFSQNLTGEKKAAKDAAVAFLSWYKTGYKGFEKFKLYSSEKPKSDGPPYTINWKNVDKHFAWIKASAPLFAAAFIKNEKKFFEFSNQMFKKYPDEEMPSGFDYERVLGSQEDVGITLKSYWLKKGMIWKVNLLNATEAEVVVLEKGESDDGSSNRF
ncbi:MAG: hypothetical protein V4722_13830 [Bacteroidota bacterium]